MEGGGTSINSAYDSVLVPKTVLNELLALRAYVFLCIRPEHTVLKTCAFI